MQALQVESLGFRDMFLLWAIRLSCSPHLTREGVLPTLTDAFRLARISDTLRVFLDFSSTVAAVWHHARRSPDIRCTCSATIGDDEWRLLRLITTLQHRDVLRASACVNDVLPRAGVRLLLDRSLHVASAFGAAGWHFSAALPRASTYDEIEIADASELTEPHGHCGVLH